MASQRQIDSARRNGSLSRGPATDAGRDKSSRNSLKHGLSSKKLFVLANESEEGFAAALEAINQHFQPASDLERELCVEIAHHRWRLRRLWIIETGLFDKQMDQQDAELRKNYSSFDEGTRLTCAFESLAKENGSLGLLTRYETRLHRAFNRAVDRLAQIQEARRGPLDGPANDGPANDGPAPEPAGLETIRQNEPDSTDRSKDLSFPRWSSAERSMLNERPATIREADISILADKPNAGD
jgi:hypothetical protein